MEKTFDHVGVKKFKRNSFELFDNRTGEVLGYVSPVVAGTRPTGVYMYEQIRPGKNFCNWRAGRDWKTAARLLAKKCGYKESK